jgi:hypothetical protein
MSRLEYDGDDSDRRLIGGKRRRQERTTPLQDAMLEHLGWLVFSEGRPACYRDFINFQLNGINYSIKQGTIRNNLSQLRRRGEIELAYRSIYAFYTIPGYSYMTPDHAPVGSGGRRDLAGVINRLAYGTASAHDVRLRFQVKDLYEALSILSSFPSAAAVNETEALDNAEMSSPIPCPACNGLSVRKRSKDLVLRPMRLDRGLVGKVTIHRGDTVSVILACSEEPIKFDIGGLVRLTSALVRIEERLVALIDTAARLQAASVSAANFAAEVEQEGVVNSVPDGTRLVVPESGSWVVGMWHIGVDTLERYTGQRFEIAWESFTGEWIRAYTKQLKGEPRKGRRKSENKPIIRLERQEYPVNPIRAAVEQKLSSVFGNSS